ncbi:hypothetical protein NM688_g7103 [Phlebia brevispora]|uniref:Uncharacterized protein n=1 Tax=Phlebia brevispora TaxID=194682 RepID=A0ACC1S942_9APHY|nr:hypothetical protein NM688_g7103 [Phlebia brevispora]
MKAIVLPCRKAYKLLRAYNSVHREIYQVSPRVPATKTLLDDICKLLEYEVSAEAYLRKIFRLQRCTTNSGYNEEDVKDIASETRLRKQRFVLRLGKIAHLSRIRAAMGTEK